MVKQMKIIHSNGFSKEELSSFKVGKHARTRTRARTRRRDVFRAIRTRWDSVESAEVTSWRLLQ